MLGSILFRYPFWHYSRALSEAGHHWVTAVWFPFHLCAVGFHIRHLFDRFQRLGERYPRSGANIAGVLSTAFINTVMRIVGALVRLVFITLGVAGSVAAFVLASVAVIAWLVLPALIAVSFALGLILIIAL